MKKLIFGNLLICSLTVALTFQPESARSQSTDPAQWAIKYSGVLDANKKALGAYTWQYRLEVKENSELLYVDLLQGRHDTAGNLQITRINQDLKIKHRIDPLRAAGQENRLKEIAGKIAFLKQVIRAYVYMSRGQAVDFFDKARKSDALGYNHTLRLDATDVITPGDSVTLFADKSSAQPVFLSFSAPADDNTQANCEIRFRQLRGSGIFYPAVAVAEFVEAKKIGKPKILRIEVETFDFIKRK